MCGRYSCPIAGCGVNLSDVSQGPLPKGQRLCAADVQQRAANYKILPGIELVQKHAAIEHSAMCCATDAPHPPGQSQGKLPLVRSVHDFYVWVR